MKSSPKLIVGIILLIGLAGWAFMRLSAGGKTAVSPQMPGGAVAVKALRVAQQDIPISYEFAGKVTAKDEVKIMSKVSGNIVAKMVQGGDTVYKGQPLFKIDNKQYLSSISSARATLTKSQATLRNTQRDVERYRSLAANGAIARQTLDSYEAQAEEEMATVEANRASLQQSIEDEQDTLIVSPVDGRIDVNEVSIGQFVTAGTTTMATVSSVDPIWVQFSMSETEYIKFARLGGGTLPDTFRDNLKLIVTDGSEYNLTGRVKQIDRGIGDTTGTITLKAFFDNPQQFLLPGMFAKIVVPGEFRQGAILIPQRAVRELLDETFVTIVTADNKAASRKVKIAEKAGNMWVVAEGLAAGDCVVVEGMDKVKKDTALLVTMITPEDLLVPAKK
ncbi:MAG TPA: efflux RND transporter periplasmic adaptor subunit [Methylomusa anaerophila]|nr:efflux RND transporter periplasmic adaptor subunit [Methylomusa anaerophila]HML87776.1 efflux RND transporter periplasmic adaptor subunit [Methylomusa anaerophila]